jgi:hypothetical protein
MVNNIHYLINRWLSGNFVMEAMPDTDRPGMDDFHGAFEFLISKERNIFRGRLNHGYQEI